MYCLFCLRFFCLGLLCIGSDYKVFIFLYCFFICDGLFVYMYVFCFVLVWFFYNDDCWMRLCVLISYLCKLSESVVILIIVEWIFIRIFFFVVRNFLFFLLWFKNNNYNFNYCYLLLVILFFIFRCFGLLVNLKWIEIRGFLFFLEYGFYCFFLLFCWMCWMWIGWELIILMEFLLLLFLGCCRGVWWSFLCRWLLYY